MFRTVQIPKLQTATDIEGRDIITILVAGKGERANSLFRLDFASRFSAICVPKGQPVFAVLQCSNFSV